MRPAASPDGILTFPRPERREVVGSTGSELLLPRLEVIRQGLMRCLVLGLKLGLARNQLPPADRRQRRLVRRALHMVCRRQVVVPEDLLLLGVQEVLAPAVNLQPGPVWSALVGSVAVGSQADHRGHRPPGYASDDWRPMPWPYSLCSRRTLPPGPGKTANSMILHLELPTGTARGWASLSPERSRALRGCCGCLLHCVC